MPYHTIAIQLACKRHCRQQSIPVVTTLLKSGMKHATSKTTGCECTLMHTRDTTVDVSTTAMVSVHAYDAFQDDADCVPNLLVFP